MVVFRGQDCGLRDGWSDGRVSRKVGILDWRSSDGWSGGKMIREKWDKGSVQKQGEDRNWIRAYRVYCSERDIRDESSWKWTSRY